MKEMRAGGSHKGINGRVGKRIVLFIKVMVRESTMESQCTEKKLPGVSPWQGFRNP
jgi:hypothetical protein